MERVAFLLEPDGQRLACLLNPETVVMRRLAGVRRRRSVGGPLTGAGRSDDPLLYTGGGVTELRLDLLFDVSVAGSSFSSEDVRELTGPFWRMAENPAVGSDGGDIWGGASSGGGAAGPGGGGPPLVTFVWGKSLNVTCVVTAVAERLEYFTTGGAPRRSWLRMRLVRVSDEGFAPAVRAAPPELAAAAATALDAAPPGAGAPGAATPAAPEQLAPEDVQAHVVIGGGGEPGPAGAGERLDAVAHRHYGDPACWRVLSSFNGIEDPLRLAAGTLLRVPQLARLASLFKGVPQR